MKSILLFLFLAVAGTSIGQLNLTTFDQRQTQITKRGMYTLGSWAVVNMATGFVARTQTTGTTKYFHEMNAYWNVVNFALAASNFIPSRKTPETSFAASLSRQQKVEKTFLFNGALDLAYVAGGVIFLEKGKNDVAKHDQWTGYGQSVILQGGFLLVFDFVMYAIHSKHGKELNPTLQNISIGMTGDGIGLQLKL